MRYLIYNVLVAMILMASTSLSAQHIQLKSQENSFETSAIEMNGFSFELAVNNFDLQEVMLNGVSYRKIVVDGFGENMVIGAPNLPVFRSLIEIPSGADYILNIDVLEQETISLQDYNVAALIAPKQESLAKKAGVEPRFVKDKMIYKTDANYSMKTATITSLGSMRSQNLARIEVSPFAYNPVQNTLTIITKVKIAVQFVGFSGQEYLQEKQNNWSPAFQGVSAKVINGFPYKVTPPTGVQYPLKYVIVADSLFKSALQPFVEWKTKQGYKVIEAYLQNPGVGFTASNIKSYLQGLYNQGTAQDPAPSYVLFVGDVAQLPSNNGTANPSNHISDMLYCDYTNDHLPEMFYGRFSANNATELSPIINKTLEYEKYLMNNPNYLASSVLIAGQDNNWGPTHGDGQINYATNNYFNATNNINPNVYLHAISGTSESQIIQNINDGAAIVNYTAHGSWQGWVDPAFNISDANSLTNAGKYPLMIGNACETNRFEKGVCIGEALLRGVNKGAVAYIGASNNSLWDEDFYWAVGITSNVTANPTYAGTTLGTYDRIFHTHNEPTAKWGRTVSDYIANGNLSVTASGSNSSDYYWEIYHVMGDPSLMPYLFVPSPMTPNFVPLIPVGSSSYQVSSEAFAIVGLSFNGQLIGSAIADSNGVANLSFPAITTSGTYDLVITAQNKQPWMGQVTVANPNGPYIIYKDHTIADAATNNNGEADFGETIDLDIEIQNITSFVASGLTMTLQSNDPHVVLIDSTFSWANMSGNIDTAITAAFELKFDSLVSDQHVVSFVLKIEDNASNVWNSNFSFGVNAPKISMPYFKVVDATAGNGNGKLDPGEQAEIWVRVMNDGHSDIGSSSALLSSNFNGLTISNQHTFTNIQKGTQDWAIFNVQVASNAFVGQVLNLNCDFAHGSIQLTENFMTVIGAVDEDFETGDLTKFAWQMGGNVNWVVDSQTFFEGSYSAVAENVSNNNSASMEIALNVLQDDSISFYRKVSSEYSYDYLNFYIDGQLIANWSGSENWARVSFPVTAGQHTFKWEYEKDYYQTAGQDKAWVDFIQFPVTDVWSSVEDVDQSVSLKMYPNPAADDVNLLLNTTQNETFRIQVLSASGQLIYELEYEAAKGVNEINIPTHTFENGVYFIQVNGSQQLLSKKLFVIR
jgi:hypothetical protein